MFRSHTFPCGTRVTYNTEKYQVVKGAVVSRCRSVYTLQPTIPSANAPKNNSARNPTNFLYPHAFEIDGTVFLDSLSGVRADGPHIKDTAWNFQKLQDLWRNVLLLRTVKSEHNRTVYFQNIWNAVCAIRRAPTDEQHQFMYWDVPLLTMDVYKELDPALAMLATMGYFYGHQYSSVVFATNLPHNYENFWLDGNKKQFPFMHLRVDGYHFFLCDEQDAYLLKLREGFKVYEIGRWSRLLHRADENDLTLADAAVN